MSGTQNNSCVSISDLHVSMPASNLHGHNDWSLCTYMVGSVGQLWDLRRRRIPLALEPSIRPYHLGHFRTSAGWSLDISCTSAVDSVFVALARRSFPLYLGWELSVAHSLRGHGGSAKTHHLHCSSLLKCLAALASGGLTRWKRKT